MVLMKSFQNIHKLNIVNMKKFVSFLVIGLFLALVVGCTSSKKATPSKAVAVTPVDSLGKLSPFSQEYLVDLKLTPEQAEKKLLVTPLFNNEEVFLGEVLIIKGVDVNGKTVEKTIKPISHLKHFPIMTEARIDSVLGRDELGLKKVRVLFSKTDKSFRLIFTRQDGGDHNGLFQMEKIPMKIYFKDKKCTVIPFLKKDDLECYLLFYYKENQLPEDIILDVADGLGGTSKDSKKGGNPLIPDISIPGK
jgi:hypothetical protein